MPKIDIEKTELVGLDKYNDDRKKITVHPAKLYQPLRHKGTKEM